MIWHNKRKAFRELTDSTLNKLTAITDEEYEKLNPSVGFVFRQLSDFYIANRRKTLVKLTNLVYNIDNANGNEVF